MHERENNFLNLTKTGTLSREIIFKHFQSETYFNTDILNNNE